MARIQTVLGRCCMCPLSLGLSQHGCHATLGETAKKAQSALGRPCRVSPSGSERMLHAYRLLYADSSSASDSLWEWHQPWIDHLLWHARTSGRQVVHRYFAPWQGLEQANTRLWEMAYAPAARSALRPTWHAWLVDYRALLVSPREVYEGYHNQRGTPCRLYALAPLASTRTSSTPPSTTNLRGCSAGSRCRAAPGSAGTVACQPGARARVTLCIGQGLRHSRQSA